MIEKYTPVIWDNVRLAFAPVKALDEVPSYPEEQCDRICGELNKIVKLCSFKPKAGDVYYHPVAFSQGRFLVADELADLAGCPYPACADLDSCQKVCDMMNRVIEEMGTDSFR